jgi:hypothetical protein
MEHIKLRIKQNITSISYKEEWENMRLVIYPAGLGKVRDLIGLLPVIKKLNLKFFLDGAKKESYEAVQILSSLGIYSGIVINENADWERLTDLMYYALCGKVPHAPIEPFQFVYEVYERCFLVNYEVVYEAKNEERQKENSPPIFWRGGREADGVVKEGWQRFFYEPTECAACEGWRICLGKYAQLKDKSGCKNFTIEWLNVIEGSKFKS